MILRIFIRESRFTVRSLWNSQDMDTIDDGTPWQGKNAFYYNQKINCMPAEGYMSLDDTTYWFSRRKITDYWTGDEACGLMIIHGTGLREMELWAENRSDSISAMGSEIRPQPRRIFSFMTVTGISWMM